MDWALVVCSLPLWPTPLNSNIILIPFHFFPFPFLPSPFLLDNGRIYRTLFTTFCTRINLNVSPFITLLVVSLLVPSASFYGHLVGIFLGYSCCSVCYLLVIFSISFPSRPSHPSSSSPWSSSCSFSPNSVSLPTRINILLPFAPCPIITILFLSFLLFSLYFVAVVDSMK